MRFAGKRAQTRRVPWLHSRRRSYFSAAAAALPPTHRPGAALDCVETPALCVDYDKMEANMETMKRSMEQFNGVRIRAHAKAHKTPEIAKLQIEWGAVGVCCQKTSEAVAMAAAGIDDILLSNEVVSRPKIERLAQLIVAYGSKLSAVADEASVVDQFDSVAGQYGVRFSMLVDVNVGQDRCGVHSPEDALRVAQAIEQASHLDFAGMQAYHGGIQHVRAWDEKRLEVEQAVSKARAVKAVIEADGIAVETVTGGGTGTYLLEASSGLYNEVQPGSFIFNDCEYDANGGPVSWQQSLFVLSTVMSRHEAGRWVVLDAGLKALDFSSPMLPQPLGYDARSIDVQCGGDEHTKLLFTDPQVRLPEIGEVLLLAPGHCDPTVNMHEYLLAVRCGRVEGAWAIAARGPGL